MANGTAIAQKAPARMEADFPLKGTCDARFAFAGVNADFLQSLLPEQLTLASQPYTVAGEHPVLFMFEKTHLESDFTTRPALSGIERILGKPLLNLNYNEFVLMVPFVKFKEDKGEEKIYCYLPVLYLDSPLSVIGGRLFWKFNKVLSGFKVLPNSYSIKKLFSHRPLLHGNFEFAGEPVIGTTLPNFLAITPILDLPVVEEGNGQYGTCIYKVEYQNVLITPVTCSIKNVGSKYLPEKLELSVPSILEHELGAFDIKYNWFLSSLIMIDRKRKYSE